MVCVGGGSSIDAAKAMWIKYEYPDITLSFAPTGNTGGGLEQRGETGV